MIPEPNPSGLCLCGCGQKTPIARQSHTQLGWVRGKPIKYIMGHAGHNHKGFFKGEDYLEQDCGYETPCWVWRRAVGVNGYGFMYTPEGTRYAHRMYYERFVGGIPKGMQLDHLCRNPLCVNPRHLEPVTSATNVQRGRAAKLTPEQVVEIRNLLALSIPHRRIAQMFGVGKSTIGSIGTGLSWKEIR